MLLLDASCLIFLDKIDLLEILPQLYSTIGTSQEVKEEYQEELPSWVSIISFKNQTFYQSLREKLGKGESSIITFADENKDCILVLDDLQARKFAKGLDLSVIGTLGLLLSAKLKKLIPEIKPYLLALQKNNMRISEALIAKILQEAGEL